MNVGRKTLFRGLEFCRSNWSRIESLASIDAEYIYNADSLHRLGNIVNNIIKRNPLSPNDLQEPARHATTFCNILEQLIVRRTSSLFGLEIPFSTCRPLVTATSPLVGVEPLIIPDAHGRYTLGVVQETLIPVSNAGCQLLDR